MTPANKSAFPESLAYDHQRQEMLMSSDTVLGSGMTIREYAAVAAMQGLLSGLLESQQPSTKGEHDHIAYLAVRQANALIAQLNQTTGDTNDAE